MIKKRLYRKIIKRLLKWYKKSTGKGAKGHKRRRLYSLAAYVTGMLRNNASDLRSIGKGLVQVIDAYSQEKAAKKFVYNKWVDYDEFYASYIKIFLKEFLSIVEPKRLIFIIDGSQMGKNHACLMISLAFGKRSIPLRWIIKEGGKGHFSTADHVELTKALAEQFEEILADYEHITLLGDGEFDSIQLQDFCRQKNWNYIFRTACDTVMYENGDRFQAKNMSLAQGQDHLFIADVEFTEQRFANVNFLFWHHPKYDDPIFLVSNLDYPPDIMQDYKVRFSIECLFKDLKSTSFNLHKTRLKFAYAISNLVMIAAMAFTFLVKIAIRYDNNHIRKRVQRVRKDRVVCSFFFFAREILEYFLEHDISFSFKFSNNSS